jgi:hypothetical protein
MATANITLADVVRELKIQNEIAKSTDEGILSVSQRLAKMLSEQMAKDKVDAEKAYEDSKKQASSKRAGRAGSAKSISEGFLSGFMNASGFGFLGGLISSALGAVFGVGGTAVGLLARGLGSVVGKVFKWGLIGSLIMNYFGEEIKGFFDPDGDGIGSILGFEFKMDDPKTIAIMTLAAGAIASALLTFVGGQILALGAIGLGALFMGIPGMKNLGKSIFEYGKSKNAFVKARRFGKKVFGKPPLVIDPTAPELPKPNTVEVNSKTPTQTPTQINNVKIADAMENGKFLPKEYKMGPGGRLQRYNPRTNNWNFASADDVAKVAGSMDIAAEPKAKVSQRVQRSKPILTDKVAKPPTVELPSRLGKGKGIGKVVGKVVGKMLGAPALAIGLATEANRVGQDPLTNAVISIGTLPLQFWDALNNIPKFAINEIGELFDKNPNLEYQDLTSLAMNKILKTIGADSIEESAVNRANNAEALANQTPRIDLLENGVGSELTMYAAPPRADAPIVVAPTTTTTTINNNQNENINMNSTGTSDRDDPLVKGGSWWNPFD